MCELEERAARAWVVQRPSSAQRALATLAAMLVRRNAAVALTISVSTLACSAQAASLAVEPEAREASAASTQDAPPPAEKKWTQEELEQLSREIMADLETLRGEKFVRPVAVKVSSKADLIEYLKLRESKTETPQKLAADEMIAKMLGVVAPEADLRALTYALLESQVGGFYDPDSDSFSLMDKLPVGLTKITLSHELDHALDDQLFDIDGTLEKLGLDTDAQLAFHAVVEGSGTAAMTQWAIQFKSKVDLSSLSQQQMQELTSMAGAPEWMWRPMLAVYESGAAFLAKTDAWMTAAMQPLDGAAVRTAFEKPPRSTEQVLHPDKYWTDGARDEPRRVAFDTAKLDEDWSVLRADTLGELMLAIVATPLGDRNQVDFSNPMSILGVKFTNDVATGWGGDRLVLLGNGEARVLRWVTVWDSPRDAGEFFGAMNQQVPQLEEALEKLSGEQAKDSGAALEYGAEDEVLLTLRTRTNRGELKRLLRDVTHTVEPRSN
jgi:hypothetical protein